jgi:tRNA(adenine34) deaminase
MSIAFSIPKKKLNSFMNIAYQEAVKGWKKNEVPIGAVIEYNGKIVSKSHNQTIMDNSITSHAEILALRRAGKKFGDWRFNKVSIFVTKAPCLMCTSAIILSRIKTIVYGTSGFQKSKDFKTSLKKIFNFFNEKTFPKVIGGILNDKCKKILQEFFKKKRILN